MLTYIILTINFEQEPDKRWVAYCKELGTSAYADTIEDAQEQIEEAIELHLNALEEVNERENFFRRNNIKTQTPGLPA